MELVDTAMALVTIAATAVLLHDYGQVTVRGYVALEAGTIVYQAAAPEAGAGAFLRLTLQPVVEGLTVTFGGSKHKGVVVATTALAVIDLAWDFFHIGMSIAVACRGGGRTDTAEEDDDEGAGGLAANGDTDGYTSTCGTDGDRCGGDGKDLANGRSDGGDDGTVGGGGGGPVGGGGLPARTEGDPVGSGGGGPVGGGGLPARTTRVGRWPASIAEAGRLAQSQHE